MWTRSLPWNLVRLLWARRAALIAENLALRQQLAVLHRNASRPRLQSRDRIFWVWLSRLWIGWRSALVIVQPDTVVRWHRQGFRLHWRWISRRRRGGRPAIPREIRDLIRRMADANPLWGVPRIHGELLKLGIDVSQAAVAKYMPRRRKPPSPTWRAFLENHKCLDHVIVINEDHLRRILRSYLAYCHRSRTHLSLAKDAPEPREIEPPDRGEIVEVPEVGGLHHRYLRRAS
jgi:hypothetical protein